MYVIDRATPPQVFSATVPANSTVIGVIKPKIGGAAFGGVLVHFERADMYAMVVNGRMKPIEQHAARKAHQAEQAFAQAFADTFFDMDEATA
jgi:hypothetical protein